MNKKTLLTNFITGETKGKGSNLYINENTENGYKITELYNYNTIIAILIEKEMLILNTTKYSQTTSVNQNMILRILDTCASENLRGIIKVSEDRMEEILINYCSIELNRKGGF
jgi:hypothetical protein